MKGIEVLSMNLLKFGTKISFGLSKNGAGQNVTKYQKKLRK